MPRVTISEPGKTQQPYRFKLERRTIQIGRGSDNDIVIECASVSTRHSVMERVEGGYLLRDTGSTNGIKQDDALMEVIDLYDGMEVLVGDIPLKFQLSQEEISELSEEEYITHQKRKLPEIKAEDESPQRRDNAPGTSSPRASHNPPALASSSPSGEGLKTLIYFILMMLAIFAGMTLRHYKETKEFLPSKIMGGKEETKPAEQGQEDEAKGETPAE